MRNLIIGMLAVFSVTAFAHEIEGTLILKGAIKTKIMVNGLKTTCKVKIEKVKNLLVEDSFGNPAYNVRADVSLDGNDFERNLSVKYSKEIWFNNLFTTATGTEVRDLEYAAADKSTMNIDGNGRIKVVTFPFNGRTITCSF